MLDPPPVIEPRSTWLAPPCAAPRRLLSRWSSSPTSTVRSAVKSSRSCCNSWTSTAIASASSTRTCQSMACTRRRAAVAEAARCAADQGRFLGVSRQGLCRPLGWIPRYATALRDRSRRRPVAVRGLPSQPEASGGRPARRPGRRRPGHHRHAGLLHQRPVPVGVAAVRRVFPDDRSGTGHRQRWRPVASRHLCGSDATPMHSTPIDRAAAPEEQPRTQIVIVGHVDHGKSTIIGRLLADTGSLPEGKLEQIKDLCARTAKPFEYAFLLDALKDERAQGITIDAARVFFRTPKRPLPDPRRAGPRRVPQEHGHRRGARRGGAARARRRRGDPGEHAPARISAVDARRAPDRRRRQQDGSRRQPAGGFRRVRRATSARSSAPSGSSPRRSSR